MKERFNEESKDTRFIRVSRANKVGILKSQTLSISRCVDLASITAGSLLSPWRRGFYTIIFALKRSGSRFVLRNSACILQCILNIMVGHIWHRYQYGIIDKHTYIHKDTCDGLLKCFPLEQKSSQVVQLEYNIQDPPNTQCQGDGKY